MGIFVSILIFHANFGVAHTRYHVIRMWGIKCNPIFCFCVIVFAIQHVAIKNNGCLLLTPMLSFSH